MVLVYDSQKFFPLKMEDVNGGDESNSDILPGQQLHQVSQHPECSRPSGHQCGIINANFVFLKY